MLLSRGGTQGVSDGLIHQSGIIYQDADADSEFGVGFLVLFSSNFLEDFLEHIRACKSQNPSLAVKVKILSRLGVTPPPNGLYLRCFLYVQKQALLTKVGWNTSHPFKQTCV